MEWHLLVVPDSVLCPNSVSVKHIFRDPSSSVAGLEVLTESRLDRSWLVSLQELICLSVGWIQLPPGVFVDSLRLGFPCFSIYARVMFLNSLAAILMGLGFYWLVDKIMLSKIKPSRGQLKFIDTELRLGKRISGNLRIGLAIFIVRFKTRDKSGVAWIHHVFGVWWFHGVEGSIRSSVHVIFGPLIELVHGYWIQSDILRLGWIIVVRVLTHFFDQWCLIFFSFFSFFAL